MEENHRSGAMIRSMFSLTRRSILMVVTGLMAIYWSHRALRMQYFRHCHRDLFRVIMFDQSVICTNVLNILNVIEIACSQVVKHATTYMLGTLGTLAAAIVTAVATAGIQRRRTSTVTNCGEM